MKEAERPGNTEIPARDAEEGLVHLALLREGAREEIDSLKLLRATSLEQHSHSFKWLTASLLALNGGGLLGAAQSSRIDMPNLISAGSAFSVGIAFALLVAVFGQRAIISSLTPLQRQIGYWMSVSVDAMRNESLEAQQANELKNSVRLSRFGQLSGWMSAIAFFAGVVISGAGMVEHDSLVQVTEPRSANK